jgi:hypothetical protein
LGVVDGSKNLASGLLRVRCERQENREEANPPRSSHAALLHHVNADKKTGTINDGAPDQ